MVEETFVPLKEISGNKKRIVSEKVKFGFFCLTEKIWHSQIKNVKWYTESLFIVVKFFTIILTFITDCILAISVVSIKIAIETIFKTAGKMASSIWQTSLGIIAKVIILISIPLIIISLITDYERWANAVSELMQFFGQ